MILGNPYKFAVFLNTIKAWNNDETFCNGILLFCVDGSFFPKEVITATLNSEINPLQENLEKIAIDKKVYAMEKENAFKKIYDVTFPEDANLDNDYRFDITPLSFYEDNCYVFAVSNGCLVRILAAKLKYVKEESRHKLKEADISEAYVSVRELNEITSNLLESKKFLSLRSQ